MTVLGYSSKKTLEPRHRFRVEVVRRLIEEQHVGLGEEQPAERHPPALAARKRADDRIPGRQPQRVGRDLELALELPPIHGIDLVLKFGLLFEGLVHLLVGHRLGEAVADGVEAVDQRLHVTDPFADRLLHRARLVEGRLLRQVAHLDAGLGARLAFDLLVHARHDLQQGGFARAVEAEHADLGAGKEAQADIAQDDALGWHDLANPVHGVDELSHVLRLLVKCRCGG